MTILTPPASALTPVSRVFVCLSSNLLPTYTIETGMRRVVRPYSFATFKHNSMSCDL